MTPARRVLTASCLAMLALGANGTAIMAALPTMRHDLGLSGTQLEWAINAYLIASAICIIPGGRFSDQFGARLISIAGLVLFLVASVVVATAQVADAILAGRALQGLGAALAVPGTLAAITEASGPEGRAAAIGAWAGFLMLGFSLGPLIGGALTDHADWRTIFWAAGVAMLLAASGFVGKGDVQPAAHSPHQGRFDIPGFLLLAVGMFALVSALHALPTLLANPMQCLGYVALAVVAGLGLLKVERCKADPLVDFSLFQAPGFIRAVLLGSIAMSCILAFLLFYNLDAQSPTGLSLTAQGAGLSLLPLSCGLLVFALSAPRLIHRFGQRKVLMSGNLLIVVGSAVIAASVRHAAWLPLVIGLFALGAGLALPYATAPRLALQALPPARAGLGSGIINACTFLGGSIGVACGAVAASMGGLTAVLTLMAVVALTGAWLARALPAEPAQ